MKLRPTIFLSGVSSEFASFRDAAVQEILKKGCYPLNQPTFDVDYREIETILREKLSEADAVIHIVGFRFGDEPKGRPADKPQRSYTQLEFDVARHLEKPVYLFLSSDAMVRDSEKPEDSSVAELQLTYRQGIENGNLQYHYFKDKDELCRLVSGIDHVAQTDFRVDISRIDKYAPTELIGREQELGLLDDAWLKVRRAEPKRPHILTFVALGGEGKTSLVAKWLSDLAFQNWPGCDSVFAWSFYSQGSREQYAASSDLFLKEAITFFGDSTDKEFAAGASGSYEKGQRLARIVSQRRAILILDGVEPLQFSPTSQTRSELKDAGLIALLKGLAANSTGLCIVTTRYSIPNLKTFLHTTAPEFELKCLSLSAGVHLLKTLDVRGAPQEFETLVEDVKGHALTLNLLGTYLRDAHGGDIRRRDLVKIEEADAEEQGGHAFRVMEAYQVAFENEGENGKRALAILRILGLFDRPMSSDCLDALLEQPPIVGLTDLLIRLTQIQRNIVLKRLEDARLLTVNYEVSGAWVSLDTHPLLREYFAEQLRTVQIHAWLAGHRSLYKYFRDTTQDKPQPTLEDLQPLYEAVAHGCQAGLQQEAFDEIYLLRINRQAEFYSTNKLGAVASNLGALSYFFESPWSNVSSALTEEWRAWLLNSVAIHLRMLGRLTEALEPTRVALDTAVRRNNWGSSAPRAGNLSQLELTLGKVPDAIDDARRSVDYADRSGSTSQQIMRRASWGDAFHQANLRKEAEDCFRDAEQLQRKAQPDFPLLYSLQGFQYCDFLLGQVEPSVWQRFLEAGLNARGPKPQHVKVIDAVSRRTKQTLRWHSNWKGAWLLDIALDFLTLSRTMLYKVINSNGGLSVKMCNPELDRTLATCMDDLRRSNAQDYIVRGLLTRAWGRASTGVYIGPESGQSDLDEAWEIAERGPMRLHMADIYLYRARLFFREKEYPWESPEADLGAARKLIEQCGYWRRKEELEDAERVILKKSV